MFIFVLNELIIKLFAFLSENYCVLECKKRNRVISNVRLFQVDSLLYIFRIILRSSSVHPPFILRSSSVHPPFELRSSSVRAPFGLRSSSIRAPFGLRSSSVHPPFELRSSSVDPPFNLRSSSVRESKNERRTIGGWTKNKGRCNDYTSVLKRRDSEAQKGNQQYRGLTKL